MELFYIGLALLTLSGAYLVWQVQSDYESKQKLTQLTAVIVWSWYLFHFTLTAYAAWRSIWPLPVNSMLAVLIGGLLAAVGLIIAVTGVVHLRSLQRMSGREVNELITSGIYKWSRNPQNVGWVLVLSGIAFIGRSVGALFLVALFALVLHIYIVYVEEPYLAQVFGDGYRQYQTLAARYWSRPEEKQAHE
jgi:protein-S-isoprenylcysteine O-methyltransferase Ste14